MTVDFMYRVMQGVINKAQNGYLDPKTFNVFIQQSQLSFLDYMLGEFQQYQVGRPIAKLQYSMTEETRQRLTPFIKSPVTLTIDVTGLAPYPGDYQQTDSMLDMSNNRIRYVQQHKLFSYLASVIDPVATNPIYLIQANGFQFYPITQGQAKLSYISTPPTIVWAFIPDANGIPVYDPGPSVDPEWYDTDCLEIIARALKMTGVNLSSQEISQYADQIKIQGQ
jgi:hypothetical protein